MALKAMRSLWQPHTLSVGDIALSAGADGATTGEGSYTFDNVDIYTPSGEYWVYYIVEDSVDGYGTLVAKGDQDLCRYL